MKTYKQIDADNIQTSETHEDGSFTSGLIRRNETRKRTVEDGTEEVLIGNTEPTYDEEGNELTPSEPIYETQPKYIEVEYSPWDELVESVVTVEWLDVPAYEAAIAAEQLKVTQKNSKKVAVEALTVEVDGMVFQADEASMLMMTSTILAAETLGLTSNPWRMTDNTMPTITLSQLKQAQAQAMLLIGSIKLGE
jgi:hypothetical protein